MTSNDSKEMRRVNERQGRGGPVTRPRTVGAGRELWLGSVTSSWVLVVFLWQVGVNWEVYAELLSPLSAKQESIPRMADQEHGGWMQKKASCFVNENWQPWDDVSEENFSPLREIANEVLLFMAPVKTKQQHEMASFVEKVTSPERASWHGATAE